jgi:hypothetical protein
MAQRFILAWENILPTRVSDFYFTKFWLPFYYLKYYIFVNDVNLFHGKIAPQQFLEKIL